LARGKPDEVIAECREAIRRQPSAAEAHSDLGLALAYQGRVEEAAAESRMAIRLNLDLAGRPRLH
jgi:Flp pilus assembly protein TadD